MGFTETYPFNSVTEPVCHLELDLRRRTPKDQGPAGRYAGSSANRTQNDTTNLLKPRVRNRVREGPGYSADSRPGSLLANSPASLSYLSNGSGSSRT